MGPVFMKTRRTRACARVMFRRSDAALAPLFTLFLEISYRCAWRLGLVVILMKQCLQQTLRRALQGAREMIEQHKPWHESPVFDLADGRRITKALPRKLLLRVSQLFATASDVLHRADPTLCNLAIANGRACNRRRLDHQCRALC
jgi:hypothetical protein